MSRLGRVIVRASILCYKGLISPLLGPTCRFFPSCSSYALMAVEKYGVIKGIGLALLRLAKCHPWHPGGIDPLR
ncbi:MAG: membrane protein insertion efficiency factor YidD [Thermodesulfobacteriota bacterium]